MSIGIANGYQTPSPKEIQVAKVPAPTQGIDARAPVGNMNVSNCLYTYNLMPAEYGMLLRNGFREWQIDLEDAVGVSNGARTLVVYSGTAPDGTDDKLFSITNEGIWDTTVAGAAAVLKLSFATVTGDAGQGVHTHYTDQAGKSFVLYADAVNGMFQYAQATDTWTAMTGITGSSAGIPNLDLTKVAYVMVHKLRLWIVERDTSYAWYLPVASMLGVAVPFFFGGKFPNGGNLAALYNWSQDGGAGLDDYMVAVSSAGDVLPYQGSDPAVSTEWQLRGTYFIGKVPAGRRFASEYAGNLYMLSSYGLISMRDLLQGVDTRDIAASSLSFKVARPLREQLAVTGNEIGWEPKFVPSQGMLIISSPISAKGTYVQYSMNLATEGWGIWRDVPMQCFTEWNDITYIGTLDNRVCAMDVSADNVLLDQNNPLGTGVPINFSILTSYTDAGSGGIFKRAQYARADWLAIEPPVYQVKILYDYDIGELALGPGAPSVQAPGFWDIGTWDNAVWGTSLLTPSNGVAGVGGMGRTMAVAMVGKASNESRLISWDIMWVAGGMM